MWVFSLSTCLFVDGIDLTGMITTWLFLERFQFDEINFKFQPDPAISLLILLGSIPPENLPPTAQKLCQDQARPRCFFPLAYDMPSNPSKMMAHYCKSTPVLCVYTYIYIYIYILILDIHTDDAVYQYRHIYKFHQIPFFLPQIVPFLDLPALAAPTH